MAATNEVLRSKPLRDLASSTLCYTFIRKSVVFGVSGAGSPSRAICDKLSDELLPEEAIEAFLGLVAVLGSECEPPMHKVCREVLLHWAEIVLGPHKEVVDFVMTCEQFTL